MNHPLDEELTILAGDSFDLEVDSIRNIQLIEIVLEPQTGHVRYGKVRAGDQQNSSEEPIFGKYMEYGIQCFSWPE